MSRDVRIPLAILYSRDRLVRWIRNPLIDAETCASEAIRLAHAVFALVRGKRLAAEAPKEAPQVAQDSPEPLAPVPLLIATVAPLVALGRPFMWVP